MMSNSEDGGDSGNRKSREKRTRESEGEAARRGGTRECILIESLNFLGCIIT
jgi:hypothetical protein